MPRDDNRPHHLDETRRILCFEMLVNARPNISVMGAYYAGIAVGLMESRSDQFNLIRSKEAFEAYLTGLKFD